MNDPHVDKIYYKVIIPDDVDYDKAPPISGETDEFNWHLSKDQLILDLTTHFATEKEAIESVEKFIGNWKIWIGLHLNPDEITFRLLSSTIIDRSQSQEPTSRTDINIHVSEISIVSDNIHLQISRNKFLSPPQAFAISPEVEMMYLRYSNYKKGKESLLSMAYWCLTIVESSTKISKKKPRTTAAGLYGIEKDVLNELGRLSSQAGDETEARKFTDKNTLVKLTPNEKSWVESVVRRLIKRMAHYAYDPTAKISQITMNDFPSLQ